MAIPSARRIAVLAMVAMAVPSFARAQEAGGPGLWQRIAVGGELSAAIAPTDDEAFFNYTDYEQNLLRLARARVFAEWRLTDSLQVETELRLQTGGGVDLPAWYLRWRPRADWPVAIQVGRIPPVIGAFARRAYGRDNPLHGMPLAYQYLTSLRRDAVPATVDDLLRMRGRGWQPFYPVGSQTAGPGIALMSATAWDTGVEAHWRGGRVEVAGAVTRGAPSVPVVRDTTTGLQWSGRVGMHAPGGVIVGISGARGRWLDRDVLRQVPDASRGAGRQTLVGVDAEYGRGAWLLRGEWLRTVHDVPLSVPAGVDLGLAAHSGFIEVRWRLHPRWQVASRVGYLGFGDVQGVARPDGPWDAPVERVEAVVGYRVSRHVDIRAGWQHNWRDGGRVGRQGMPSASVLVWF